MTFRELYETGITFDVFINQDDDIHRERILEVYSSILLEEGLEQQLKAIAKPFYILAFAETWCPDCIINVPALEKLAKSNPLIQFAILPREGYETYMEPFKVGGKCKIPTFLVFDEQFQLKGSFIELPKTLKHQLSTGNQVELIVAKRKYRRGEYTKDTIKELIQMMQQV